jgi:hypothetical protein
MIRWSDALTSSTGGSDVSIVSYEIEYASTYGIFNYLATVAPGVNQYLQDTLLVGGNEYQYMIRATNYLGDSLTFSDSVSGWTA